MNNEEREHKEREHEETDIQEIYKNALQDPTLISTLDIDKLLDDLDSNTTSYLENKTMEMINKEVYDAVCEVVSDPELVEMNCKRLIGYRYVPNICDLHLRKHVKTISLKNPNSPKQVLYGNVANVKFTDNGAKVLLFIIDSPIFRGYMFHNYLTFQKLSDIEQLILMAYSQTL